ncbi:hypothetical protein C0431_12250 [bacterium]|nr:hypothetical protein [bacterium]
MIARASNKYKTHYLVQHAIMTNRSQTGIYPNNGYWLAADNTISAFYEIELKIASDVDVLEWVQRPDSQYGQRGTANPMNIEFYKGDGSLIEKVTMNGNRAPDSITRLLLPSKVQKWLVETEETIKYWTGAEWSPVQETG